VKKILLAILGAVVLLFSGLYLYISNMDWNEHKEKIVQQVMEITGKKMVFDGELSFSLLPTPYLRAKDVKVYNENEASPLATIPSLVAELELMPLLKGGLQVNTMSLVKPTIFLKITKDRSINWGEKPTGDGFNNSPAHLALNSVMLEKATVDFVDENNAIHTTFSDVTAEVSAESINGPYRIEGNLIKEGNPFGFAFSLGEQTEGYPRSMNVAITHPSSDSYIRFDGQIMIENNACTGNVLLESKKPIEFLRKILKYQNLGEEYNKPLTISTELKSNRVRVDLANFIIKYGQTIGAGNILIPLNKKRIDDDSQPKIEVAFEMTDLDLNMVVGYIKDKFELYRNDKAKFAPNMKYDLSFDLKSVKTYYNGFELQDFVVSFDIENNKFTLKNFIATGPANTQVASRGRVFAENDLPSYVFDFGFTTENSQKMLEILNIKANVIAPGTFNAAQAGFSIAGTPKDIKFSPINLVFDKMNFTGSIGVIFDIRNSLYISLNTENMVNLDNYLQPLPADVKNKELPSQLLYRFKDLKGLNDWDWFINLKTAGEILDNNSFGTTDFSAEIINSKMEIKNLNITNFAESNIEVTGALSGFGGVPEFEKINYKISTKGFPELWNKIKFTNAQWLLFKEQQMTSRGIISGKPDNLILKTVTTLGDTDFVYDGTIKNQNNEYSFAGDIEIKAPNFSKLVSQTLPEKQYQFLPSTLFLLNAKLNKNQDGVKLQNLEVFFGANTLKGQLDFSDTNKIIGDLQFSDISLDSLFYGQKAASSKTFVIGKQDAKAMFLRKPSYYDKSVLDYSLFGKEKFEGKVEISRLTYKNFAANNVTFNIQNDGRNIKLEEISADVNEGTVTGKAQISIEDKKEISGLLFFKKQPLANLGLNGIRYGIMDGTADMKLEFSSLADSQDSFMLNLKARLGVSAQNLVFKGWNLQKIYDDLSEREKSTGLLAMASRNLDRGTTIFMTAEGNLVVSDNNFSFENTKFATDNYVADLTGGGSIKDWQIEAKSEIVFPTLKEMPAMYATFSGSLENPKVDADIAAIAAKYDNYWQQLAEEKKQRQIDAENKLRNELKVENDKVRKIVKDLEEIVLPNLQGMQKVIVNNKSKLNYQRKYKEAERVYDEAKKLLAVETHEKIAQADIDAIKGKPENMQQRIEQIRKDMDKIYEEDMRTQYNKLYDDSLDVYKRAKVTAENYTLQMMRYDFEGRKFNPPLIFKEKKQFKQDSDKIEALYKKINDNYLSIMNDYYGDSADMSLYQVEQYSATIFDLLKKSEEMLETMKEKIEDNLKFAQDELRYAYDPQQREEDIKKAEKEKAATKEPTEASGITEGATKAKKPESDGNENGQEEQQQTTAIPEEISPKKTYVLEMHKIDGDSKLSGAASGTITRADEPKEKPQQKQEEKNDKPSFLRKVIGEIAQTTGKILKIE